MRQKIIFIDIDGPLAWATWDKGYVTLNEDERNEFSIPYHWVKEDCDALKTILDESNAKLVLSSDWRFQFSFRQMKDIFQHYGIHPSHLLDMTCQFSLWNKMSRPSIDHERALQVVKWAKDNKISNWIAIDDLRLGNEFKWMRPRIPMWRHVAVDGDHGNGGRLRDKIEECINKLNR
jgi:hypothetical protein